MFTGMFCGFVSANFSKVFNGTFSGGNHVPTRYVSLPPSDRGVRGRFAKMCMVSFLLAEKVADVLRYSSHCRASVDKMVRESFR